MSNMFYTLMYYHDHDIIIIHFADYEYTYVHINADN